VTCAISWGRCSLIGFLVVMFVVFVLVLLFISFPVDKNCEPFGIPNVRNHTVKNFMVLS